MRQLLKSYVQKKLIAYAKKAIKQYKPIVVGVAGSVGKTSTKEAIFQVLSQGKNVRKSTKSYNNEFGVPLTILGIESGYSSPVKWLSALLKGRSVANGAEKAYPEIVVLEMGSDHLGDVKKLMDIAPPTIGVLTAIAPVHLEFFGTLDNVKKEESSIIRFLQPESFAVINGDDEHSKSFEKELPQHTLVYGLTDEHEVYASDMKYFSKNEDGVVGAKFTLHIRGESKEAFIPHGLGKTHIYSALAAAAVGSHLGISIDDIVLSLLEFSPPAGRMRCLDGIKHTKLIDDTYNSSPRAVEAALEVVKGCPTKEKKFAVLGDMAELGNQTEELHREVGAFVPGAVDILITVGEKARDIARGAKDAGMNEDAVFTFAHPEEAGLFLQERLQEGDVALVKGSQAVRLEKVVKEVMAEPQKAEQLLVRQEENWISK